MSARQAFIPRPQSTAPSSESRPSSTDAREKDGMFNGSGKPRSVAAFLGQKRGSRADTPLQGGSTPTLGLARANSGTHRRSFDGIQRPEMTPLSIIPYPTTAQLDVGIKQTGTGQTPRKTVVPGAFDFARPMTPASAPRALKKGFGIPAENQEDDRISNGNAQGVGFIGPDDEADVRGGMGTGMGGYMRVFEGSGGGRSTGSVQSSLEHDIVAPVPGYAHGGLDRNAEDEDYEGEGVFARSSRSSDTMVETEGRLERSRESHRLFGGMKRGVDQEDRQDVEERRQGPSKRMKQAQHDPREYSPISTPRIPSTPARPASTAADALDPSLIANSLFENIEEVVNLGEIQMNWKRWRECATEDWLKGADKLAQEYADILNMAKDHLTEKVTAYANMIKAVDERRSEANRNIEIIQGRGNIVRENISKFGVKK